MKHCTIDSAAAAFREDPSAKEKCIDCFIQNMMNQSHRGYRVRDTNHRNNTETCPTQHSLARRRLRLWRRSELNVKAGNPTVENSAKDTVMESEP